MTLSDKITEYFDPAIKGVGEVYSWTPWVPGQQCGASFSIFYWRWPEMEKRPVFYGATRMEAIKKATEYRDKVLQHMSRQKKRTYVK